MAVFVSAGPVLADDSRVAAGEEGAACSCNLCTAATRSTRPLTLTLGQNNPQTLSKPRSHLSHCCRRRIMDLQAVIVFVGGFGFCAVVGYIVSVFGAKEQASLFVV